jgi:light-regulated signal transduction histidine kinase (bacteriophytochrome)
VMLTAIRRGETVKHYEAELMTKSGSTISVSLTISPIRNNEGEVIAVSSIARDVTDLKTQDRLLQERNKELESFTYSVSHDLRAPIRRILGYVEMLYEDFPNQFNTEAQRVLDNIRRNTERMRDLIDDLLTFSKVTREQLSKSTVDMNTLVRDVVIEMNAPSEVSIEVSSLDQCFGDYRLLRQVVVNLLNNAIKYSRKQARPSIAFRSVKTGHGIKYTITDNGVGFDPKYTENLFKVFQRLHHPNEFEGTGIGLAIVNQIIQKHDGKVFADGKPGEGATFGFWIPHQPST